MGLDGRPELFRKPEGIIERGPGREDGELLAPPAGEKVGAADASTHQARQFAQDLVADAVTMLVVDRLEVVDVEQHQGKRSSVPPCPGELEADPLLEMAAVPAAGQSVGTRHAFQFGVGGLQLPADLVHLQFLLDALGDIAGYEDQVGRQALGVAQRITVGFQPEQRVVRPARLEHLRPAGVPADDVAQVACRPRRFVRCGHVQHGASDDFFGMLVAQLPQPRRRHEGEPSVELGHRNAVRRGVQDGPEALLARAQGILGELARGEVAEGADRDLLAAKGAQPGGYVGPEPGAVAALHLHLHAMAIALAAEFLDEPETILLTHVEIRHIGAHGLRERDAELFGRACVGIAYAVIGQGRDTMGRGAVSNRARNWRSAISRSSRWRRRVWLRRSAMDRKASPSSIAVPESPTTPSNVARETLGSGS